MSQRIIKDYDGKDRAFFFDNLDEAGWNIGIAVDKDAIFEVQYRFIKIALSISIALLCAGIIVSFVTAGRIARPIMASKTIANNIAELNLNIDIDDKYLKRKDEAGGIVKAIKETTDKLRSFTDCTGKRYHNHNGSLGKDDTNEIFICHKNSLNLVTAPFLCIFIGIIYVIKQAFIIYML